MALRKPLVIIAGVTQQLPVGDTIATGSAIDVGIPYSLQANITVVPPNFQYLIHGRLLLDATSIIRAQGQVVVI